MMQRILLIFSILLIIVIAGELIYLFVLPNRTSSVQTDKPPQDNVSTLLKSIPRRQLFLVLNQIEIASRSTTKSSVLTARYEGVITKIISTPDAKMPYPLIQFVINEGKDKVTAAYTEKELLAVTVYKKDGEKKVKIALNSVKEGMQIRIDEEFDVKNNRLLKTAIRLL